MKLPHLTTRRRFIVTYRIAPGRAAVRVYDWLYGAGEALEGLRGVWPDAVCDGVEEA